MMFKYALLEALWLLTLVFAPSKVAKPFPPSDVALLCWLFLVVENFHLDSMVVLRVTVKFVCGSEMCFFVKCGQSG